MKIDHIYYITINPQKEARMEQLLSTLFTKDRYTKVSGVNGNTLNINQLIASNYLTKHGVELFYQRGRPFGTLGCYLAHTRLWDYIHKKHSSTAHILILEDDISFTDATPEQFEKTWVNITDPTNLPPHIPFDMIYYDHNTIAGKPINAYYTVPYNGAPAGYNAFLSCYLVKVSSIPKLLKICLPIGKIQDRFAIDGVLRNSFHKINALFYNKHLAYQRKQLGSCRLTTDRFT